MVHILIRQLVDKYLILNAESFNMPIIIVPSLSLLIFAIGYMISFMLHKIPILKKYDV